MRTRLDSSLLMRHPCHDCEDTTPEEGRGDHNRCPGHGNQMTGPRFLNNLFGGEHRELIVGGNSSSRHGQFLRSKAVKKRVRTQTGAEEFPGGTALSSILRRTGLVSETARKSLWGSVPFCFHNCSVLRNVDTPRC